jgi:hypothetical protein
MSGMHAHFRKSFPIIPKLLYFTISKTGVSMQLHLGPVSKSWGTAQDSLSIDAPGHMGLGFRKTNRKKHDPLAPKTHKASFSFSIFFFILSAAGLYIRLYYHLLNHCTLTDHPAITLGLVIAATIVAFSVLWHLLRPVQGPLFILICWGLIWLTWAYLFASFISPSIHC